MDVEGVFATQGKRIVVRCPHCNEAFYVREVDEATEPEPAAAEGVESPDRAGRTEAAFRETIIEQILARDFDLPMLPHAALRVVRLTANPDVAVVEVAKTIMTDQTIAAKILDICNSPVYAGAAKIESISQAVVRLGLAEIKNLMLAISMKTKIFRSALFGDVARNLWVHSIACAFAARTIARETGSNREAAFLGGLLHDLGKMVLIGVLETGVHRVRDETRRGLRSHGRARRGDPRPVPHRRRRVDLHEVVASGVDQEGCLPPPPVSEMGSLPDTVAVVCLADRFCHQTGKGVPASEIDLAHDSVAARLGIAADRIEGLVDAFVESYDAASGQFL